MIVAFRRWLTTLVDQTFFYHQANKYQNKNKPGNVQRKRKAVEHLTLRLLMKKSTKLLVKCCHL